MSWIKRFSPSNLWKNKALAQLVTMTISLQLYDYYICNAQFSV